MHIYDGGIITILRRVSFYSGITGEMDGRQILDTVNIFTTVINKNVMLCFKRRN